MKLLATCLAMLASPKRDEYSPGGIRRRRAITRGDLWAAKHPSGLNWTSLGCLDAEGSLLKNRLRLAFVEKP